jgi:hypothetical protein
MASTIKVPLAGYRFGKLLVLRKSTKKNGPHWLYECQCDCGRKLLVQGNHLRRGQTVTCGCRNRRIIADAKETATNAAKTGKALPPADPGRRGTGRIGSL